MQVAENREANMTNQQDALNSETPIIKPERDYRPRYPKKLALVLSFIQLGVASLAIITQVVMQVSSSDESVTKYLRGIEHLGTGIWCGILFALSGATGIAASLTQNTSCIVANIVISVFTIIFGFIFFIISSIGTAASYNHTHAMFAIQIAINVIQIMTSSSFSAISCRTLFNCCSDAKPLNKTFPKKSMMTLCSIQLFIAILVIIMGVTSTESLRFERTFAVIFKVRFYKLFLFAGIGLSSIIGAEGANDSEETSFVENGVRFLLSFQ